MNSLRNMNNLRNKYKKQLSIADRLLFSPILIFGLLTLFFQRNFLWILEIGIVLELLYSLYLLFKYKIVIGNAPFPWPYRDYINYFSDKKAKEFEIRKNTAFVYAHHNIDAYPGALFLRNWAIRYMNEVFKQIFSK